MSLNFTAIARESDDAIAGASHYQVYYFTGSGDACSSGTLRSEFSSASYTPTSSYTYLATGLLPRTTYSFCLKARDSAGNISNTTQYYTKQTQDVTPPSFDGIQGITYDSTTGNFTAAWNRSTSTDRSTYKFSISKNNGAYTTYTYNDSSNPAGISFTKTSLGTTFADLDLLKIYVNACDNASTIVGGTDNCTTLSTPLTYTVPDVSPPSNFSGIDSGNTSNVSEGSVSVGWYAPTPASTWSSEGYRGFLVYSVDSSNNITQLKDCACAQTDCSDHPTACTVTGLDARRTYKFHVRAYDNSRNITTSLNPATSVAILQTTDTTAPTFSSAVSASIVSSAVQVSWSSATDNQYASESGASITYQIYRKAGSTFASLTAPENDADSGYPFTRSTSPYTETSVLAGTTYYYTVCAKDASNNRRCSTTPSSIVPPDITPPIVTAFATNKTSTAKSWNLSWTMSDNVTATGSLSVQVYKSYSASAGTATTSDTLMYSGLGTSSLPSLGGRQNTDEYVNYLLVVSDAQGNQSTANLTVYSTNSISITSITRNSGSTAGGKLVFIQGSGFDSAATVAINGNACTNTVKYYTSKKMGCVTPALGAGTYNLVVTNSDGSAASMSYTYYTYSGAGTDHICDNPTQPTGTFYSGSGSAGSPYLICTPTQFGLIGGAAGGSYFTLMDNLDVASFNTNNFGNISYSNKYLAGNNMVIANWTRSYTAGLPVDVASLPYLGLFQSPSGSISDFGLVNVNLSNTNGGVGAIAGYRASGIGFLTTSNLFAQGTVTGANSNIAGSTGGLYGFLYGPVSNTGDRFYGTVSATSTAANGVGGLYGRLRDASTTTPSTITNCFSTGTVTSPFDYTGGLFGSVEATAGGLGVTITGSYSTANISGANFVGGLIGGTQFGSSSSTLTISSSYATGSVTSSAVSAGGLAGYITGTAGSAISIRNSYATGNVVALQNAGGLIGNYISQSCSSSNCSPITNSYATGSVTVSTNSAGGLIGYLKGSTSPGQTLISNSYATGSVQNATGTIPTAMGGLVGTSSSATLITGSYATAAVSGGYYAGGLVGAWGGDGGFNGATSSITNSYATGAITANRDNTNTGVAYGGGFVALVNNCSSTSNNPLSNTISQSYSTSNVTGPSMLGGFISFVSSTIATCAGSTTPSLTVSDCYSTGTINGSGNTIGGFMAQSYNGTVLNRVFHRGSVFATATNGGLIANAISTTVNNGFWDGTVSSQLTTSGSLGTLKTTSQMQTQATFTGFDFTTTPVWKISAGQYPKLNWQP